MLQARDHRFDRIFDLVRVFQSFVGYLSLTLVSLLPRRLAIIQLTLCGADTALAPVENHIDQSTLVLLDIALILLHILQLLIFPVHRHNAHPWEVVLEEILQVR